MQSLFGLPINTLMIALAAVFIVTLLVVLGMAIRNRVMLKMGLRPIPRRPGMTALIIIGVMLSTVIISAAFGTGDTMAFSIRNIAIRDLKNIDELVIRTRAPAAEGDTFGQLIMDFQMYEDLYKDCMLLSSGGRASSLFSDSSIIFSIPLLPITTGTPA